MNDDHSGVDRLVLEGPHSPGELFRPASDPQRVLAIDGAIPKMIDLETGDIRRFENGTPVTYPMVSLPIDLHALTRLLVQGTLEPRPSAAPTVVVSLNLDGTVIDVRSTPDKSLEIIAPNGERVRRPIGESLAIVVQIDIGDADMVISARNADTQDRIEIILPLEASAHAAVVTVGGPSTAVTGTYGRVRSGVVVVDVAPRATPPGGVRRAVHVGRRAAAMARRRSS